MQIGILVAFAAIIIGLIFRYLGRRVNEPQVFPCSHCQSMDTVEIGRNTIDTRTVEYMGSGGPAGGDIRLQLEIEVTYRCNTCRKSFKRRITQT